jgi:hypothetical protein
MPQSTVTTAYPVAFVGMNPDNSDSGDNYISRVSTETALQIPFGVVVMTDASNKGTGCLNAAAQADIPLGIVPYSATYKIAHELANVVDSNGNLGLLPGTDVQIKRRGRLWVQIDENVVEGDAVKYRTANSAAGVGPGTFRKGSVGGNTVDISKFARWVGSNLASNGYGLLEFDFTMQSTKSSD